MSSSTELLQARLEQLKRRSFAELSQLPPQHQEELPSSEGRIVLSIWKDAVAQSELRIVVQAYRPGLLSRMQAAGFRATEQGIKELEQTELEDFS